MGVFQKSKRNFKYSHIDEKLKVLESELKKTDVTVNESDRNFLYEQRNKFENEEVEKYDWRKDISENKESVDKEEEISLIRESKKIRNVKEHINIVEEKSLLNNQIFNIPNIEKKIDRVLKIYDSIQEGLLDNPPETTTPDPLTPLNQEFVTIGELNKHYNLFINRIQQQLSTLGGGGEVRLKYLDDIVGIATNAAAYDGKYLKYNDTLGKFQFDDVISGLTTETQSLNNVLNLGNTSALGINVGVSTFNNVVVGGSTTALVVNGDARITGILTIGTSSLTLNGVNDTITIGGGLTITNSGNAVYSGVITATSFVGNGSQLTGIATFSGNYNDLTNKPTIPTNVGDLNNNVGFITSGALVGYATQGYVTNSLVGYATQGYVNNAVVGFITTGALTGYATQTYVNTAVSNLVNSAPATLDTLNELASALGNNPNFATTVTNSLAGKANLSGANFTGVVTSTGFIGDYSSPTGSAIVTDSGFQATNGLVVALVANLTSAPGSSYQIAGVPVLSSTTLGSGVVFSSLTSVGTLSAGLNIASGQTYKINNVNVLSSSTLGSSVTSSSLTGVGTLTQLSVSGVSTFTTIKVGTGVTISSGIVTATSFVGDGSQLTGIAGSQNLNQTLQLGNTSALGMSVGVVTATDFNSSSDIALKENVEVIENPLDKLLGLRGVTFDWKSNKRSGVGVVAQDVEKVLPQAVNGVDNQKTVNYNAIIGLLVESVKQQQKEIEELKKRLS